jgi:hypothetical protein
MWTGEEPRDHPTSSTGHCTLVGQVLGIGKENSWQNEDIFPVFFLIVYKSLLYFIEISWHWGHIFWQTSPLKQWMAAVGLHTIILSKSETTGICSLCTFNVCTEHSIELKIVILHQSSIHNLEPRLSNQTAIKILTELNFFSLRLYNMCNPWQSEHTMGLHE